MTLDNNTIFRGYLSHLRAMIAKLGVLEFQYMEHPENETHESSFAKDPERAGRRAQMRETWDSLREDTMKVLGVVLPLWSQIPESSELIRGYCPTVFGDAPRQAPGNDPLRITLKALKLKADRARRKDESITLLKSWDLEAKKPKTEDT